ncbi:hypothetical protein CoNPh23_CDS0023 [Staphylococcus phage S-CoN_Ph23]|nr:hypothetical protein CoNPh18_CDS0083 [Staphylococcus phage S-CoN_Ph18]WNM54577.1 hypothetical protein CoNPh19_CDS0030 [Staphylococcus phage S-CoN_Ph19]WNM54700.1 hypothetical protein CoNPh20_CDS0074 [Staphylococcus phage S-CoN_Ph20]WNM54746.1 hypothetical protein CoNPh21_CDS0037 [Staphylococcus phage S-CoN_Ph21]WNM54815.1 hypothetical protein CoNPh22_CDS0031 [Staphylococcus phage S-CoN_Ph22]WNM54886.1 hypothetical protein CoNPh23_CDS0023 [Staphylococcus phage S-CoN_Ph23]WNM55085.1 hypothet
MELLFSRYVIQHYILEARYFCSVSFCMHLS